MTSFIDQTSEQFSLMEGAYVASLPPASERPSQYPGREEQRARVLVVDDDPQLLSVVSRYLRREGYDVATHRSLAPAIAELTSSRLNIGVVLADLELPDGLGTDFLDSIERLPEPQTKPSVVLMTGKGSVESAVDAMRRGAYDYLLKPFDEPRELLRVVGRAMDRFVLVARNQRLEMQMAVGGEARERVYFSEAMKGVVLLAERVAPTNSTVLIRGESGSGKEVLARQIHEISPRRSGPFVAVNCGALIASLQESELFGHSRGSFTGATSAHRGFFEQAHRGTLFLDEVGELSPSSQVLLLRVLQEGVVRPVGGAADVSVDVRVIAATHRDLSEMVESGAFRQDLFYRLNVFEIGIPPLRERRDDIVPLAQLFLRRLAEELQRPVPRVTPEVLQTLAEHDWPGNVRELRNAMERAIILSRDNEISVACLPQTVRSAKAPPSTEIPQAPLSEAKQVFERRYLEELLRQSDGNLSEASRRSGVDRSNLRRLIRRHKLDG